MSVVVLKDKSKLHRYRKAVMNTILTLDEKLGSAGNREIYKRSLTRSLRHMEKELKKLDAMLDDSVDHVEIDALEYQNIIEILEEIK